MPQAMLFPSENGRRRLVAKTEREEPMKRSAWIVAIAAYVLIEKLLPPNRWLTRISGLALIVGGLITALG